MRYLGIIIISVVLILVSCDDSPIKSEGNPGYVYLNSSFEVNGKPDTTWWYGSDIGFAEDAPILGGQWSLMLTPGWIPQEGYAESQVTGVAGDYSIRLEAWMKTFKWRGSFSLRLRRNGELKTLKEISDTNSEWKKFSMNDTLSLAETDTVIVHLSAGTTEVVSGKVFFDLVKLVYYPVK